MDAPSQVGFFHTIDRTGPHFEAHLLGEKGDGVPQIGQTKTKEFSPEKREHYYRFFEETALGAQGP